MVKKFLGIFKRDKSAFTKEELEWQVKIGKRIIIILGIILFLSYLCIGVNILLTFFDKIGFLKTLFVWIGCTIFFEIISSKLMSLFIKSRVDLAEASTKENI